MIFETIAIGAGAGWLLSKLIGKKSASDKIQVVISGRIHKVTFSKITIMVDAIIKNPTKESFKFRKPFITLLYKKEIIGLSTVSSEEYELKPYSELPVKSISIDIYLLKLSKIAADVFKIFQTAKGNVQIEVNSIVPWITAAGDISIPYNQTIVL